MRLHAIVRMLDVDTRSSFGEPSAQVSCSERLHVQKIETPAAAEAAGRGGSGQRSSVVLGAGSSLGAEAGRFLLSFSHDRCLIYPGPLRAACAFVNTGAFDV